MTVNNVRGAGRPRAGATDTTMLIWKVIEANPGLSTDEIWERVEHRIPAGYALRRYATSNPSKIKSRQDATSSAPDLLRAARRWVLRNRLWEMRRNKSIEQVGDGYRSLRDIDYRGNAEVIDVEGSKAAEHMAMADALRTVEKMLGKVNLDRKYGACLQVTRKEYEAIVVLAKWVRAKGSA